MKKRIASSFAFGSFLMLASFAQIDAVNSLSRTRATFTGIDGDKDGKLGFAELQKQRLTIDRAAFDAQDADKDGSWSRDEFAVYYRGALVAAGQKPAADLENEVVRVIALRKAKAEEEALKRGDANTPKVVGPGALRQAAKDGIEPVNVEARLQRAIDDLEKKAQARSATREDFQRVRDAYEVRAKAAIAAAAAPADELQARERFQRALEALEQRALANDYSREEFTGLRDALVRRARESQRPEAAAVDGAGKPIDIDARLERALAALEKKADARNATREDFQAVRDAWEARAKSAQAGASPVNPEPSAVDVAARLHRAIDDLERKALAGEYSREEFTALRTSMISRARAAVTDKSAIDDPAKTASIEARFEDALATLETKALARGASREDFERVKSLLAQRARAAWNASNGGIPAETPSDAQIEELSKKLHSALERLERAAQSGSVTRAQFADVRAMLVHRARAAAKDETPPRDPPASTPGDARRKAVEKPATDPKDGGGARRGANPPKPETPPPTPVDPPKEDKPSRPKPGGRGND